MRMRGNPFAHLESQWDYRLANLSIRAGLRFRGRDRRKYLMLVVGLVMCGAGVVLAILDLWPWAGALLYVCGFLCVVIVALVAIVELKLVRLLFFAFVAGILGTIGATVGVALAVGLTTAAALFLTVFQERLNIDQQTELGVRVAVAAAFVLSVFYGGWIVAAVSNQDLSRWVFIPLLAITGVSAVFVSEVAAEVWSARPRESD